MGMLLIVFTAQIPNAILFINIDVLFCSVDQSHLTLQRQTDVLWIIKMQVRSSTYTVNAPPPKKNTPKKKKEQNKNAQVLHFKLKSEFSKILSIGEDRSMYLTITCLHPLMFAELELQHGNYRS